MMAFTDAFYADWRIISVAAAAFSMLVSVLLLMLSRLFSLKNLEQTAKTEFTFAISTILIVLMTSGLVTLVEPRITTYIAPCLYLSSFGLQCTDTNVSFPEQQTLIDWMKLYMETPIKCVQKFMEALYLLSIPVEAIASVYMEIFMSEHASGFGVKWIAERISNLTSSFGFYMFVYFLIIHTFNFIKYYAGFFFSVGVVLRAFPPMRGAGAYLMALSLGLYFVFPLAYVSIATLYLPHAQSVLLKIDPNKIDPSKKILTPEDVLKYTCVLPEVAKASKCMSADVGSFYQFNDLLKTNFDSLNSMINLVSFDLSQHISSTICIFPLFSLIVLMTFVLNTTNLFGGNIPEIGRGLIKLI